MKINFIFLFFIPVFFSCQNDNGRRNIKSFYFPIKELKDGKVYEYRSVGNEHDPPMYWYYKFMKQDDSEYLLGVGYDAEFLPDQLIREEVVSNGMMLVDFYMYEKADSISAKEQVKAEILAGNVFPFFVRKPANVLLTSLSWSPPSEDEAKINLVRNRQYDSDTSILFKNKKIPAVTFNTIELIEHDNEGRLPLEFSGMEVYAKGIGLVSLQKNITEDYQLAYELKNIYSIGEFEEKYKVVLQKEL